jgi:hypothetical protein
MSRWTDKFDNHAIHETLRQVIEWASTEFEDTDSEHEAEQRRLQKVLGLISSTIEGMDNEFFPEGELTQLNNHLRHQGIWNELNAYSSNGVVQHLRAANDHMESQVPRIFQMGQHLRSPESQRVIRSVEEAFDKFTKSIDTAKAEFEAKIVSNVKKIDALKQKASDLDAAQKTLADETEAAFNEWSTEHTEAQNARSTEFSNNEIERNKIFDKSQKAISDKAEEEHKRIFAELNKKNEASQQELAQHVHEITTDMNSKHQSILKVHDLVAGDGVAGGYKKSAKDEGDAANRWRNIAMGSFSAAAIWTLFKVVAYWKGWVSTTPGNFDWAEVISATSLTLILLATAAYAAAQSKLHRVNEQRMSWFSLEVGALDPFISSLTEDQQRVLKIQLSQRLFGQNRTTAASEIDNGENGALKTLLDTVGKLGSKSG